MSSYFFNVFCFFAIILSSQKFVFSNDLGSKLHISFLNIVTEENSDRRVNDRTKYVIEDLDLSYHFSFRNNAKCTEVSYANHVIYKHNSGELYPKALAFHLDLNKINLWVGDSVHVYQKTGDVWNKESTTNVDNLSEDDLQVVTSDSDYKFKHERSGVSVNYFLYSVHCTEIKYKNQTIWKYDQQKNVYPNRVYFNLFKQIALIKFPDRYIILNYRENVSNLFSDVQIVHDSSSITVVTEESGSSVGKEDVTRYHLREYNFTSDYLFDDNTKCVELKHGNNVFWKLSDNSSLGYPKSLCFHRDLNLLFLELNDSINTYKCVDSGCMLIKNIQLGGFTQSNLSIVTENGLSSTPSINDPSAYGEDSFGFGTEYIFNGTNKCVEVKYKNTTVWTKDSSESESELPRKMFFHIYTRMIIMDFSNFYLVYMYQDDKFNLITKDSLSVVTESDFKLMANDGARSFQLNRDHYDFIKYPYGYAFVFMLKDEVNCNEIDFKNTEVFRLPANNEPPKVMYVNWDMKMILLESPTFVNAYMYLNGRWMHIFSYPDDTNHLEKLLGGFHEQQQPKQLPQEPHQPEEQEHHPDQHHEPEHQSKQPVEQTSALRGCDSKPSQEKSDSSSNKKMTYILISGSVVVVVLLLLLAFAVFHYLK